MKVLTKNTSRLAMLLLLSLVFSQAIIAAGNFSANFDVITQEKFMIKNIETPEILPAGDRLLQWLRDLGAESSWTDAQATATALQDSLFNPFDPGFQPAYGQLMPQPEMIERGRAHEIWENPDGTFSYKAGSVPVWTFDAVQDRYVPHKVTQYGNNTVDVQSGLISWRIRIYDADIYDANFTSHRATERWLPEISGLLIEKAFQGQTVTQNSTGVFVTNSYSATFSGSTVNVQVIYAIYDGRPTERIVIADGVPANFSDKVKISREWTAIDSDEVVFDESVSATIESTTTIIDSLTVKQQTEFKKNGELVLRENLKTAGENYKETHYREGYIKFVYGGWAKGLTSIKLVDDTSSDNNPTQDGDISTNNVSGASCGTSYTKNTSDDDLHFRTAPSGQSTFCARLYMEWSVSSITDGSDITDVDITVDVDSASNSRNCDVYAMTNQPSVTGTASTLWTDIGDGTLYVDEWTGCKTAANNVSLDLGTDADAEVESRLTNGDWFAIGITINDIARTSTDFTGYIGGETLAGATPKPTLTIVYTLPSVTVPITINMRTGSDTPETAGVSFTITCTGGGGSHDGNAASQNFTCSPNVTVTVDVPADAATSRFRFSDGTTQKTFTSCASGTCSTTTYSDVTRQYKQIVDLTGSPADMPASVTVTRTIVGSSGTQEVDEASTDVWPDQGSTISIEDPVSISATERWDTSGTVSWTVDQSRTISNTYYQQFQPTITATGITNTVTSVTVTRTQQGNSGTEDIPGDTATGVWADYNTLISVEDPVSISASERWDTSGTVSWTQTDATNRATGQYYRQWLQTVDLTGSPADMPASVTVTRTILNSAGTQEVDETSTEIWADHSSTISIEDPVSISATERWDTSGTVSWTVDQGRTISNTYYQQFKHAVTASSISASVTSVTVTRTQLGGSGTEDIAGSTATDIWADYNTSVSIEDPVSISATERWDTSGTVSWSSLTTAQTLTSGTYYRQWLQTVDLTGVPSDMPASVTVTRTILNSAGTQEVDETSTEIWADHSSTISIEDPVSISASERWDTSGTVSWTVDQGRTISNTYYQQFKHSVTASSISASVTSVTVTRTQLGGSGTEDIAGSTATDVWADYDSTLSIEDPVSISATERWDTSGTVSWSSLTTAQSLTSGTYYRQWKQTVDLTGVPADIPASITVTRTILGASGTQEVDENSVDIWADHSSSLTLEDPVSISGTERWDTGGTTSYTVDQGRTISNTYYQQFAPTITATGISASVTSVTVTRTQLGAEGTEDIAGGTATTIWADYNTLISVEDPVSISATERWDTSGTVSWTQTDATNRATGTYYQQWRQIVDLTGSPADMPASVTVTRTILNSAGTQEVDESSTTIWADNGSTISIEDPVSISATERWDTSGTVSWSVDQGRTISNTYYQQFQPTITATGISASVTSVTVTRTQQGSSGTEDIAGSTATGIWADYNTLISVEDPVSISATERWDTSGTVSWTQTDATNRATGTYFRQWKQSFDLVGLDLSRTITVDRTILGVAGNQEVGDDAVDIWADHNTNVVLEDPLTISAKERYDTAGTTTYLSDQGRSITNQYYRQFGPDVTATGISASVTSVTITHTQLGVQGTEDIAGSTATQIWADYGTDISIEDPVSISSDERWDTSGTVSWTQTDTTDRVSGTYYRQWRQIVDLVGSPADIPASVTVTRTILGSSGTQEVDENSVTIWADHSSSLTLEDPVSISATERWDTADTTSYSVTTGRTISNTYYQQFAPTVTATGISASVTSVTVTRTQLGSSGTEDIAGSTATTIWADYNTLISVEDPVSISATERWDTSGTVSWTQTDATNRATGQYYRQWKQTVDLAGLEGVNTITVTRTILGASGTQEVDNDAEDIWPDHSSTISLEDPLTVSSTERFDTGDTISFTVDQGRTIAATYYQQFKQTVTATGISASVTSITVTRTQLGSTSTEDIAGSTATDIWTDDASTLSIEDPISISSTERWDTGGTVSWSSLTSGQSLTSGTYYRQWKQTVDLAGLEGVNTITVTRTQLNSEGTQEADNNSVDIWADHSSTISLEDPLIVTANEERFDTGDTVAYTVNQGRTIAATYYQQFNPDVTATGISASVTSVTVTRTQLGSTGTEDIAGGTATGIWIDDGATLSIEDPVSISATERWDTSGTVSWIISDATAKSSGQYFRQWKQDFALTGLDSQTATVTRTILGNSGTQEVGTSPVTIWADHSSSVVLEDPVVITANEERYDTSGTTSYTADQGRTISNAYFHQWNPDITVTGVDSGVSVTVTRTQLGNSGTESINGGTSTGVWADDNTILSISDPISISSTERWDTSGTVSWTITDATARSSGQYYQQFKQTITLSGLDPIRSLSVTRTQLGASGGTTVSGSTATEIWADNGSSFSVPDSVTVVASEERFKSYNSTSQREYTISVGASKTYIFQHEFNMLFRVVEEHEGVIFSPMPAATFTGTIVTANGTEIAYTFNTQVTDDHLQPATGRDWVKNGTTQCEDITWREVVVQPNCSASITAYGNFDVEITSKHLGYANERHFRLAVNQATAIDNVSYNADTRSISFNATASGTQIIKVEFLTSVYDDVENVYIDGVAVAPGSVSTIKEGSNTGVATITGVSFSEHTIQVVFFPAGTGSGSGGGGSGGTGGGSSGSSGLRDFFEDRLEIPFFGGESDAAGLELDVPTLNIEPGKSDGTQILITWEGKTVIEVISVKVQDHPEWVTIEEDLPAFYQLDSGADKLTVKIPITVSVPRTVEGTGTSFNVEVVVKDPSTGVTGVALEPIHIVYAKSFDIAMVFVSVFGAAIMVGIFGKVITQKKALSR